MCYNASDLLVTQNTLEDITVSKEQNNSVHSFIHTKLEKIRRQLRSILPVSWNEIEKRIN